MKKILMTESQVNGIVTGYQSLDSIKGFKEKAAEIGRMCGLGSEIHTTLNGEYVLTSEYVTVILGVDQGDGSKFYRPSMFFKSISMHFNTSDPAGYETAKGIVDRLFEVVSNSQLVTL